MSVARASQPVTDTSSRHGGPERGASPASVLLVDDQPQRLLSYEAVLSALPVNCVQALSGAQALKHMMGQDFAVILLDVKMPDMDGFEVARLLREHPRFEHTPIIFVTGAKPSERDQLLGYELGAIDYLLVPFSPEVLRAKVAVLVELYRHRRDLQTLNESLQEARARLEEQQARAAAESEAQLNAAFEHPTDLTLVMAPARDESGAVADWIYRNANTNALNALGLAREGVIGRRLAEVIPGQAENLSELCAHVLAARELARYEARFGQQDFLFTLFPMGANAVAASGQATTQARRAQEMVEEAERRRDEFVAVLAHELRNPLAPIRNAAEALRHLPPDSATARAMLRAYP